MPTWNDIKKSVGLFAEKATVKTRELTDTASLKIKIASREADRDTEYKRLGRLTYAKLKNTDEPRSERLTVEISKVIERLDAINTQIRNLKAEEEERRATREAEKAEREAEAEFEESLESDGE